MNERETPQEVMSARDLYYLGDLIGAARKEAGACDRDGYGLTARMLRELADLVELTQTIVKEEGIVQTVRGRALTAALNPAVSVAASPPGNAGEK